jgi:phosphopantothenoylcysteine decarboxylase / phosphopantothenate---cysteine ligase
VSASSRSPLSGRRVLLGVTGGVAAYKAAYLLRLLTQAGASVQVVMTRGALQFVGEATFAALSGRSVRTDVFDEAEHVVHVRMAHEADLAVVAPATANVIAKLAFGIADDMLTSTLLEARCPLVIAPAMHTGMYENEATQANIRELQRRGVEFVGPVSGSLAAGDEGVGRMAEPEDILARLEDVVARGRDLAGRRILVTAGPTHEPIDPVRFIGNRSTGKMGYAIAEEARDRGADVVLVSGPVSLPEPDGVRVVRVETAQQMRDAVMAAEIDAIDAVIKAAAVADFRPEGAADRKLKKESGVPEIRLVRTADVLRELGEREGRPVLVGFAAETNDLDEAGRRKLVEKHLDLIVVNEVGREGTGFGSETNDAMILSATGDDVPLRTWTKRELAAAILDRVGKLLTDMA